jgi:lipoyl-dependent peroxiredoxin
MLKAIRETQFNSKETHMANSSGAVRGGAVREGRAVWTGGLRKGSGILTTQSDFLNDAPYSFVSRFEQGKGTNPEELIAAAHSGCFAMALSKELESSGIDPERIEATARVSLGMIEGKPTIDTVHLAVEITSRGGDQEMIRAAAERAKTNCPVSRLLNASITLETRVKLARAA